MSVWFENYRDGVNIRVIIPHSFPQLAPGPHDNILACKQIHIIIFSFAQFTISYFLSHYHIFFLLSCCSHIPLLFLNTFQSVDRDFHALCVKCRTFQENGGKMRSIFFAFGLWWYRASVRNKVFISTENKDSGEFKWSVSRVSHF